MISPPTAENTEAIRRDSPLLPSSVSKFISIFTHKDFILYLRRRILILLFIWPFHSISSWLCQDLVSSMGFLFSIQSLSFFQPTNLPEVPYFVKKKKRPFFPLFHHQITVFSSSVQKFLAKDLGFNRSFYLKLIPYNLMKSYLVIMLIKILEML